MIKYQVRSRDLIDLVNDIKSGRLVMSPYFQRNLVWRDLHQKDFVETILKGFPFPQVFIARGDIDVDTMTSISCVVDGQQRLNAITRFVTNEFDVDGKKFKDLGTQQKEDFLKYQVPVIDLDIKATEPDIIEIFTRLNRTFYALSAIEKMSTEYATVDFMLIAKFLCGLIEYNGEEGIEDEEGQEVDLRSDPNMPPDFLTWIRSYDVKEFRKFMLDDNIFSPYEASRLVHLMYVLNIMATISYGYFQRNEKTREILEESEEKFEYRTELVAKIGQIAGLFNEMQLEPGAMWWNKANAFSLFVLLFWNYDEARAIGAQTLKTRLNEFEADVPGSYALAAREAVNNRKQRRDRHVMLANALELPEDEKPLSA